MVTGYYFESEEEDEVLYIPWAFELVANKRDILDNRTPWEIHEQELEKLEESKPHVHLKGEIFFLDCHPDHLENIVLGIRTDEDFRKKILDGEVELIEIPERYIGEFKRIYDLRQERGELSRLSPLEEEYFPLAKEIFAYIDNELGGEEL